MAAVIMTYNRISYDFAEHAVRVDGLGHRAGNLLLYNNESQPATIVC
jgi:hypothetical protein